jgi:hypothetical protein
VIGGEVLVAVRAGVGEFVAGTSVGVGDSVGAGVSVSVGVAVNVGAGVAVWITGTVATITAVGVEIGRALRGDGSRRNPRM